MVRKWTEDEEEYLEHYIREPEGTPHEEIAEFLGRSVSSVYNKSHKLRKELNIPAPFKKNFTEREIEYIKSCYKKGISVPRMADHLKRPERSIQAIINKHGISTRKFARDYDKEIRTLAAQGAWKKEIARRLGLHEVAVMRYTLANNIECQKAPKAVRQRAFREIDKTNELRRVWKDEQNARHQPNT